MKVSIVAGLIIALVGVSAARPQGAEAQSSICYGCVGTYLPGHSSSFCAWNSGTSGYDNCLDMQDSQGYNQCQTWGFACVPGGGGGQPRTFLSPSGTIQLVSWVDETHPDLKTLTEAGGLLLVTCKGIVLKRAVTTKGAATIRHDTAIISI